MPLVIGTKVTARLRQPQVLSSVPLSFNKLVLIMLGIKLRMACSSGKSMLWTHRTTRTESRSIVKDLVHIPFLITKCWYGSYPL